MKISEIKLADVATYIKLSEGDYAPQEIAPMMAAATAYIKSYTGLSLDELDQFDDIYIAYMVLCQDMYDNRSLSSDGKSSNKVVETILGLHDNNLV